MPKATAKYTNTCRRCGRKCKHLWLYGWCAWCLRKVDAPITKKTDYERKLDRERKQKRAAEARAKRAKLAGEIFRGSYI